MFASRALTAAALLVLVSCAAPMPQAASPTRAPELGASAEAFDPPEQPSNPGSTPAETPPGSSSGNAPQTSDQQPAPPTDPAPETGDPEQAAPPPSFRVIGATEDLAGDQGLEGPDYADVRRVTIEDDGQRARVRVEVGGALPTPPTDGEVIGVGVNLLRQDNGESAYQLFADGGADGWFAYLHTPEGFVQYPGEFRVGGPLVEFVIPWNAIAAPPDGPFDGFLDWSRERPALNAVAEDRAPDSGRARFDRS